VFEWNFIEKAAAHGFADPLHFSRAFKKLPDFPPPNTSAATVISAKAECPSVTKPAETAEAVR